MVIAFEIVVWSEGIVDMSDNGLKNTIIDRFAESIAIERAFRPIQRLQNDLLFRHY